MENNAARMASVIQQVSGITDLLVGVYIMRKSLTKGLVEVERRTSLENQFLPYVIN